MSRAATNPKQVALRSKAGNAKRREAEFTVDESRVAGESLVHGAACGYETVNVAETEFCHFQGVACGFGPQRGGGFVRAREMPFSDTTGALDGTA